MRLFPEERKNFFRLLEMQAEVKSEHTVPLVSIEGAEERVVFKFRSPKFG